MSEIKISPHDNLLDISEAATQRLIQHCIRQHQRNSVVDPDIVRQTVKERADVHRLFVLPSITLDSPHRRKERVTTLHYLLRYGNLESVSAMLGSPLFLDFTIEDGKGYSPLYMLCIREDAREAAAVLGVVVERLQSHPEDRYDFSESYFFGLEFLSLAAGNHRLALFWSRVKDFPYDADNTNGILIQVPVGKEDWERLGEEQGCFILGNQ